MDLFPAPLHAEGVHGLPAGQALELGAHEVGLEEGEVEGRQVVQVVPGGPVPGWGREVERCEGRR